MRSGGLGLSTFSVVAKNTCLLFKSWWMAREYMQQYWVASFFLHTHTHIIHWRRGHIVMDISLIVWDCFPRPVLNPSMMPKKCQSYRKQHEHIRAVWNCSFRFDINNSVRQAFISKPITISIKGRLDFETNNKNEIALWAISISITISISKSPNFGWYFETISISKPILYYISPPKCWH